jgi:dTDP-4-dehydrorhamnose 3,5-epimerase-like enzyme
MRNAAGLVELSFVREARGDLGFLELEKEVGFAAKRFFIVSGVPANEVRGQHAHVQGEQFLIALQGSLKASTFDGESTQEFELNKPDFGLYMPKMSWGSQWNFSSDAKLLVLCSNIYDPSDYITDLEVFKSRV